MTGSEGCLSFCDLKEDDFRTVSYPFDKPGPGSASDAARRDESAVEWCRIFGKGLKEVWFVYYRER